MIAVLFFLAALANGFVAYLYGVEGNVTPACIWSFSAGIWFAGFITQLLVLAERR